MTGRIRGFDETFPRTGHERSEEVPQAYRPSALLSLGAKVPHLIFPAFSPPGPSTALRSQRRQDGRTCGPVRATEVQGQIVPAAPTLFTALFHRVRKRSRGRLRILPFFPRTNVARRSTVHDRACR